MPRLPKLVLLSPDPHGLFSRVMHLGKSMPQVRLEAIMLFPEVHVGIFPEEYLSAERAATAVTAALRQIRHRLSKALISEDGTPLAPALVAALRRRRLTLSCAESCSGGKIADIVTSIPGSSEIFRAGIVSYGDESKRRLLGVTREVLERHGAVSRQVVRGMLAGALDATGASCAVATSGIAGPGGGTKETPVGLVYIGAAFLWRRSVRKVVFRGMERSQIKHLSAALALRLLLGMVMHSAGAGKRD